MINFLNRTGAMTLNDRCIYFLFLLLVFGCVSCKNAPQDKEAFISLESGEPIRNGNSDGVGDFDCGCLTGRIMGLVDVDADEYPDLFMQNSKWYPGTFLYYFRKFNGDGTPVFSKGVELKMPDNAAFGGTI